MHTRRPTLNVGKADAALQHQAWLAMAALGRSYDAEQVGFEPSDRF